MVTQDAVASSEEAEAERVVAQAQQQLKDTEVVLVQRAWAAALPALQRGRHLNPVHHTAHVLDLMVQILLGEEVSQANLRIGIVAAIFHDAGNAFEPAGERKLRKQEVRDHPALRLAAIAQRRRHMINGGLLVRWLVPAIASDLNLAIDVDQVVVLVENHDNPTLAEFADTDAERRELLFVPQGNALTSLYPMSAYLREADRLWMLTVPGVVCDLIRNLGEGKAWDPPKQIEDNVRNHRREGAQYAMLFDPDEQGGIDNRSAFYRSAVGPAMFDKLPAEAEGTGWRRELIQAWLV